MVSSSDRGQVLVESLFLFLILATFFSILLVEAKDHRERSEPHRLSTERGFR